MMITHPCHVCLLCTSWITPKVLYCHVLLFLLQRSITDEINRESRTDILTIAISYGFMFLYIAIFLGHFRSCASIFVSNSARER